MTYPAIPSSAASPLQQQGGSIVTSDQQPVLVAAAGPARQTRSTVAFRIILVIPHLVVLYFLGGRGLGRRFHRLVGCTVHSSPA
jgi:hypothetical protein